MNRTLFSSFIFVAGLAWSMVHAADPEIGKTARYCNPLPIPTAPGSSASGDVTVIQENGKYYMFCTGGGAWISEDLVNWEYHQVQGRVPVAPGIIKYKDYFYMSGNGAPLYRAKDILGPYESAGDWKTHDGQAWTGTASNGRTWEGAFDVHFFIDNDKPYLFYPGRGTEGIYAVPLDTDDLSRFAAAPKHLFGFDRSHVWERYGEMNEYPDVSWIEGPWMIKHNNTYYLEYSANGTQWFAYATGVYTAKSPTGPFTYAPGNPILRKTTGIVTGSGHGCVVKGPDGNYWQFYTIVLANPPGGRRIGMDPVGFDEQGNMFISGPSETPQWAPGAVKDPASQGDSGSIPLTINKMRAWRAQSSFSSERPGRDAAYAIDNASGTWWEPDTTDTMPTLTIELSPATEFDTVQRFTIDGARLMFRGARRGFGRRSTTPPSPEIYQYRIDVSIDGETYKTVLDRTENTIQKNTIFEEIPPVKCRYVRLTMTNWPRESPLGILEFTVFGIPAGFLSSAVPNSDTASSVSSQMDGIRIVSKLKGSAGNAKQLEEKDFGGYVMVYFKDQTQSAYMAISRDGYSFTDLNNGRSIFDGARLAEQKGVRDPHITRGPDGGFYLAMTDLHIFGQRAGYRDTPWQRPIEKYGWGNNRALVLMKSFDLIHWTVSDFQVDTAFPQLGDIDCSWAPQTIYDEDKGRMMVYFTIRYNNRNCNLYCSYTDDDFTRLETIPEMIPDIGGLDGDITKVDNQFHLHYVSDAKVLHAVSDKIRTGYKSESRRIDPETKPTEAPNVFKRLGTNTWVLMYDVYGGRPNNMGFSETKDFVTYKDIGHFNEGVMKGTNFERPKHGAVTYLTLDELKAIADHWKIDIKID